MSRKNEFFKACKPDNHYIFKHSEAEYDWDDIVNAFIAGGLYADEHPRIKWHKLDDETLNNLLNYQHYLVFSEDNDEYSVEDGLTIKMYYFEKKFSHVKEIKGPPSGAGHRTAKRSGAKPLRHFDRSDSGVEKSLTIFLNI